MVVNNHVAIVPGGSGGGGVEVAVWRRRCVSGGGGGGPGSARVTGERHDDAPHRAIHYSQDEGEGNNTLGSTTQRYSEGSGGGISYLLIISHIPG